MNVVHVLERIEVVSRKRRFATVQAEAALAIFIEMIS